MQFHDANGVIPLDAAADVFLAALAITLLLDTQISFVYGEYYTMEAIGMLHGDPVPACARRYLYVRNNKALPPTLQSVLIMFWWVSPQNM